MIDEEKPKYKQVYEYIKEGITSGEYEVGTRIPSETQLARRFTSSRLTVSRALRDLEREGLLRRRRGSGSYVLRNPNAVGSMLGLVMGDFPGIFSPICQGLAVETQARQCGLLFGKWPKVEEISRIIQYAEELCEQYISRKVAGVFFSPLMLPADQCYINAEITDAFDREGIAVVLIDHDIYDFPRRSRYDLIGIENVNGGYTLTRHLLDLGYRRIEFVRHNIAASTITARMVGYQQALIEAGLRPEPGWIHQGEPTQRAFAEELLRHLNAEALVCVNDNVAANLILHFIAMGIRIPQDLAIVGFDDDQLLNYLPVSLTTYRQPCEKISTAAVKVMLDRLADPNMPPQLVSLSGQLIIRESCGSQLKIRPHRATG